MEREVLLSIENLTVRYGKETALQIESPILIEKGDRYELADYLREQTRATEVICKWIQF